MTTLTQTDNSITNTSIVGPDGHVLYEVSTPTELFGTQVTTISRQGSVIATVEWHNFTGTILRFEGRESLLDDVFPTSWAMSTSRTYVCRNGAPFKWKSSFGELYCVDPRLETDKNVIAIYHRVISLFRTTQSTLSINQDGLGRMDELVVTWIIMEKLAAQRRRRQAANT